jgi:hypothetical protein
MMILNASYTKKIKRTLIFWYIFRNKKYKLFLKWNDGGYESDICFKKAKFNVPYFYGDKKQEQIWIRQQKFKNILKQK